jgi:hypothetical protein
MQSQQYGLVAELANRTAVLEAERARIAAARALHREDPEWGVCRHDGQDWPCATEEALA